MQKRNFNKSLIGLSVVTTVFLMGTAAFAFDQDQDQNSQENFNNNGGRRDEWQIRRHEGHRQFALGVCVGQTLAQQGVTVPAPQPGQPPSLDSNTRAALQAAVQSCRAEMEGNGSSPTPSPTPSNSSTGTNSGTGSGSSTSQPSAPSPTESGT